MGIVGNYGCGGCFERRYSQVPDGWNRPSNSRRTTRGGASATESESGRSQLGQASFRPSRTLSCSVGDVEGAGRRISDPRVVLVQYPVGEARGWATRVGVVPNCTGIRIRTDSPRHTRAVMNGEGGSGRHSQCSRHDRPRDQLLHSSPRSRLDSVKHPCQANLPPCEVLPSQLDVLLRHGPPSISGAAFHTKRRIEIARLNGSH
jgi:hypothetical protein